MRIPKWKNKKGKIATETSFLFTHGANKISNDCCSVVYIVVECENYVQVKIMIRFAKWYLVFCKDNKIVGETAATSVV